MSTTVKTGWLKDSNGDKFAPKTLASQVQMSDGTLLEHKINEGATPEIYVGNGDMPETATIQILLDGSDEEQDLKDELKEYVNSEMASAKTEIVNAVIAALPKYNGGVS